jgi:FkbM family methyltransferase
MIRKHFPAGYMGYAIDVGASDGVSVNTTYTLEKMHRWTVLSVDANPDYAPFLQSNRAFVELCACGKEPQESAKFHINLSNPEAHSALTVQKCPIDQPRADAGWKVVKVPVRTVEQLMKKWEFPRLDALCVDTEGTEVDVLYGCDLARWEPKVVVVESWTEEGPVHDYMKERGYKLVDTLVQNYVYLRRNR